MATIDFNRVPSYYHNYIKQVHATDLKEALQAHTDTAVNFLKAVDESKWNYRYAEGKWSIKELVQHIIDTERIMCYRALRFSRKDETPLAGFDENLFAANSKADRRTKQDLIEELQTVQQATVQLFASFDEEQLEASGTANRNPVYVRGIGFIIVGHIIHHLNILKERYL